MKKSTSLIILAIMSLSFGVYAQKKDSTASADAWTLKQCIEYALANSLNVQRSNYNVENYEVNLLQSKMNLLPTLNGQLSTGWSWGRSVNPVTNSFVSQQLNSLSPAATSSLTLFNGLRIQNQIKQSVKDVQASKEDLQKAKNDLTLNIASLFVTVIFNKEQVQNATFQLRSSQQQYERTKKQVAAGSLPKANELNLDAQVATNEVNLINRENALALSLLQLKQALQLPASTPLDVTMPEIEVEDLVLDQSRQQIFETAKETLPEVRSAGLKVQSATYAVRAARGNLYPRLSLNGSINSNYSSASDRARFVSDGGLPSTQLTPIGVVGGAGGPIVYGPQQVPSGYTVDGYGRRDQLQDNIFKQLNVTLSIPIFNNLQTRATYQRSIITRRLAEISQKEIEQTLRQSVETAYNDAVSASKTYNSSLRQVAAREEAYRMTKQRFDIGAVPYVEYQVSENDYFQSKSDLARAKYDFILKKKVLDFYQGKTLEY